MKKYIITLLVFYAWGLNAQTNSRCIGLRIANEGQGGELSFQTPLAKDKRLELDLGLNSWAGTSHGYALTGIYQWTWELNQLASGLNWYAGLGLTAGNYSSNVGVGIVGQIGVEYNFNIPLQLSLDWRPTIFNTYYTYYVGNGFSIRYRF